MVHSRAQRFYVAHLLALGTPVKKAAELGGVRSHATIYSWLEDPAFIRLRDSLTESIVASLAPELTRDAARMVLLWGQWLDGDVSASDSRIASITPTILGWISKLFDVVPPPCDRPL